MFGFVNPNFEVVPATNRVSSSTFPMAGDATTPGSKSNLQITIGNAKLATGFLAKCKNIFVELIVDNEPPPIRTSVKNSNANFDQTFIVPVTYSSVLEFKVFEKTKMPEDTLYASKTTKMSFWVQQESDNGNFSASKITLHATGKDSSKAAEITIIVNGKVETTAKDEPLPDGWYMRETSTGKTYYIDHSTKSYALDRPSNQMLLIGWDIERQSNGELFYVHILSNKKTRKRPTSELINSHGQWQSNRGNAQQHYNGRFLYQSGEDSLGPLPEVSEEVWERREDITPQLENYVNHVNRTTQWEDPRAQDMPDDPLPDGWGMRITDQGRVPIFIDHFNRTKTYNHPRTGKLFGFLELSLNETSKSENRSYQNAEPEIDEFTKKTDLIVDEDEEGMHH